MRFEVQRKQRCWLVLFLFVLFCFVEGGVCLDTLCMCVCLYYVPVLLFVLLLLIGPPEDLFVYVGKMDDGD